MKLGKVLSTLLVAVSALAMVNADAASFGRSSSSSSSSRSSTSSYSAPSRSYSAPAASPSPSRSSFASSGSMGERKTAVTAPVAAQVQSQRAGAAPAPSYSSNNSYNRGYAAPAPTYSQPVQQAAPSSGAGSAFLGGLGGGVAGSLLGNALFGNNNHGNGGGVAAPNYGGVPSVPAPVAQGGFSDGVAAPVYAVPAKPSYGFWSFIGDVLGFVAAIAVLGLVAFGLYKGYKFVSAYIKRERGIAPVQPFSPTAQFWTIQKAFGAADISTLNTLLGPDLVDEGTRNLSPVDINISNVSHEVVLANPREFSVHYKFVDAGDDVDQVWHFNKYGSDWKLNGVETV